MECRGAGPGSKVTMDQAMITQGVYMLRLAILMACVTASGCSKLEEISLSPAEKINRAFPPSVEARVTAEQLRYVLGADAAALQAFDREFDLKLELRALSCAGNVEISRLDSIDTVRELPLSRDCLNARDAQLLRFLQFRMVASRLAQSALRPLLPLGRPAPISTEISTFSGFAASAAGVAILKGTRGEIVSIEIPGGRPIATLQAAQLSEGDTAILSPNGRMMAIREPYGNGIAILDTESGARLFSAKDLNNVLAWLPGLSAALVVDRKSGELMILDFQTGEVSTGGLPLRNPTWALQLSDSGSSLVVGATRDLHVMEYARTPDGIQGQVTRSLRISGGQGVSSPPPTLMRSGKSIVFPSVQSLLRVDLEDGRETLWNTGRHIIGRYAKLGESTLLVESFEGGIKSKPWVLDIEKHTLAPAQIDKPCDGLTYELRGRSGFMRRNSQSVCFGDQIDTGEPLSLEAFLSARDLEEQIAKLERQGSMGTPAAGNSWRLQGEAGLPAAGSPMPPRGSSAKPPALPPTGTGNSPLAQLAKDAQVESVGVYEAASGYSKGNDHRPGIIDLDVRRSSRPLVLVLSSYEPVVWKLNRQAGAEIRLVLISSYHPSRVEGAGDARVIVMNGGHAYQLNSPEYQHLTREVVSMLGKGIDVFQGSYSGERFSVGGK